jgi:hypothetical protein
VGWYLGRGLDTVADVSPGTGILALLQTVSDILPYCACIRVSVNLIELAFSVQRMRRLVQVCT